MATFDVAPAAVLLLAGLAPLGVLAFALSVPILARWGTPSPWRGR